MFAVFGPGTRLMNSLKYPAKFGLIGFLIAVVVSVLVFELVTNSEKTIAFTEKELVGIDVLKLTRHVLEQAQKLRATPPMTTASSLAGTIRSIDDVENTLVDTLNLSQAWASSKKQLEGLIAPGQARSGQAFDEAIGSVVQLIVTTADNSYLTLDPQLDSYYLMDTVATQLPKLAETAARIDAVVRRAIDVGQSASDERRELIVLAATLRDAVDGIKRNLTIADGFNPALGSNSRGAGGSKPDSLPT